jgi:3',5'-nucleoside bisphosphate phosphatase
MNPPASIASPSQSRPSQTVAGYADLHLHTLFSDGTFTPEELAGRGAEVGLIAMALTDHDTVEGCVRMGAACQQLGIEFIPGTELTSEFQGHEVHLLGFFLDIHQPRLLDEIKKFQAVRQERIHEMVSKLNNIGVPLRAETVFALANCRSPGRPHVARALAQEGLCSSMDEAFDRFLKKGRPAWVPKYKISATDAIGLIHQAGGLAVLAHPGLNHCDQIIPQLKLDGLDGIECFHSKHTPTQSEYYLALAGRLHLAVSGGSDCHGFSKGKPLIGTVKLPDVYLQKLKEIRRS